jgi:hypothetical protein
MSDATLGTSPGKGSRALPLQAVGLLGLLLAVGILVVVGFIAPDSGVEASTLLQGVGLAAAVAAVPVAILLRPADPGRVIALGGAMTVAGLSTMFGGNLVGLPMPIVGTAILLVGASQQPPITLGLVVRLTGHAVLLGLAVWLSLGETTVVLVVASVLLAAMVATSSIWGQRSGATR